MGFLFVCLSVLKNIYIIIFLNSYMHLSILSSLFENSSVSTTVAYVGWTVDHVSCFETQKKKKTKHTLFFYVVHSCFYSWFFLFVCFLLYDINFFHMNKILHKPLFEKVKLLVDILLVDVYIRGVMICKILIQSNTVVVWCNTYSVMQK